MTFRFLSFPPSAFFLSRRSVLWIKSTTPRCNDVVNTYKGTKMSKIQLVCCHVTWIIIGASVKNQKHDASERAAATAVTTALARRSRVYINSNCLMYAACINARYRGTRSGKDITGLSGMTRRTRLRNEDNKSSFESRMYVFPDVCMNRCVSFKPRQKMGERLLLFPGTPCQIHSFSDAIIFR